MKRRRNYLPLWALLVAALVAIACVSAFGPVRIGGYEMKTIRSERCTHGG